MSVFVTIQWMWHCMHKCVYEYILADVAETHPNSQVTQYVWNGPKLHISVRIHHMWINSGQTCRFPLSNSRIINNFYFLPIKICHVFSWRSCGMHCVICVHFNCRVPKKSWQEESNTEPWPGDIRLPWTVISFVKVITLFFIYSLLCFSRDNVSILIYVTWTHILRSWVLVFI